MEESKKNKLYLLMLNRYKEHINEKETKTIAEMRGTIKPQSEFIVNLKKKMLGDDYKYEKDFLNAVNKAIEYLRGIETFEFAINFWMNFEEIEAVKAADSINKAVLFASLIRSFGSDDTKVLVAKSGNYYGGFKYDGVNYLFVPKTSSLLAGDDASNIIASDSLKYSFNDREYVNFEE